MQIYFDRESQDSLAQYPWFAFQQFSNGKRGYLALAESESELLEYLSRAYPQSTVTRYLES